MICSPNDKSEIINNNFLLAVLERKHKIFSISNEITVAEFELVETLLKEADIEGYSLSYLSDNFFDKFLLSCIFSSYCLLCEWEHISDNTYIRQNKKSYSFFYYRANQNK